MLTVTAVETWWECDLSRYGRRSNHETIRHMGPMAQDFYAAFGLGTDDKHIATIDADGVALAAIQGLNQKLTDELARKDTEIAELRNQVDQLQLLVETALAGIDDGAPNRSFGSVDVTTDGSHGATAELTEGQ